MSATVPSMRELPSIDRILADELFRKIEARVGRDAAVRIAREAVAVVRDQLEGGSSSENAVARVLATAKATFDRESEMGFRRVINATGVIIHTNLGRSPLSAEAVAAIAERASRYCSLEFDIETGKRGRRGERAESLICELTGAEAAVIVNNCASAAFLTLKVLATGKEVIISRGELVEIGGDFRVPDVLSESGAALREIGTTNRTKLSDYEKAISDNTGLILKVHPSNFRVIGFTAAPSNAEIAALARDGGIPFVEDAGSGALIDLTAFGLGDEPLISRSIADGVDLVLFSGDKLLGGVQAGFIVGKAELVDKIRRNPMYRALRVDKLAYAAIEATLRSYARGSQFEEIPTLRMLSESAESILDRSERLVSRIKDRTTGLSLEIVEGESVVGGGSAPDAKPKTWLIAIERDGRTPEELAESLRRRSMPVIGRISEEKLAVDLRTVSEDEEEVLVNAIADLVA
jgi:L-seryl-tRNA(Ser) seleniumtransferase